MEDDGYTFTAPVGSYPDGASPYGVLDMAGNVESVCPIGMALITMTVRQNAIQRDCHLENITCSGAVHGAAWLDMSARLPVINISRKTAATVSASAV